MSPSARRVVTIVAVAVGLAGGAARAERAGVPVYLWLEADWFVGVKGTFASWSGEGKPTGTWRIAGPGVSAEWSQGGESEWNSMAVPASETHALVSREIAVPRAGDYRLWVRYVDHREKKEPFRVRVVVAGKAVVDRVMGIDAVVPVNDEYQLYWGYSFGWGAVDARLSAGPARIELAIDQAGEAFRQVDAVLLTDDLGYRPVAREKPPFAYLASFGLPAPPNLRGSGRAIAVGEGFHRPLLGGADFTMWTRVLLDAKSLVGRTLDTISARDLFLLSAPARGIRDAFLKQFGAAKDVPIVDWGKLRPVLYLGEFDLSAGSPLRAFFERTKLAFAVLTNYARPSYDERVGRESYQALTGALAGQFLGFIHGEGLGSPGVGIHDEPLAPTRRAHVDAFGRDLKAQQAEAWTKVFHTPADPAWFSRGISCLGSDLVNAMVHELKEQGARVTGYEEDATTAHVPLRLAFQRGAARQYGGSFINYASGNFGDACNYFTQDPIVNRGAGGWFHSKYAVTDGVTIGWYRKLYYLNYLGGASGIFWEQGLENQWLKPGPGEHPVGLSPFGRVTVEFQRFVDRVPERGEPYTPVAILLGYGAGYERASYRSRMHDVFDETADDLEIRELLNVLYHPIGVVEGRPAAPDLQSLPNGVYGNLYDVLVDRPERARALLSYPVVWAAGDVALAPLEPTLREYLRRGGTLVTTLASASGLEASWTGVKPSGARVTQTAWQPVGSGASGLLKTTPYEVAQVQLDGATPIVVSESGLPLAVRHTVGEGAIVTLLVAHGIGLDERAHPMLPLVANGLFAGLLPVEVRRADGSPLGGEILYQLNRTPTGWLVTLVNNGGVDKTQSGIARVDRTAQVAVQLRSRLPLRTARELTQPRRLPIVERDGAREIALTVEPGDLQVVELR